MDVRSPHNHSAVIARSHSATADDAASAIAAAIDAEHDWRRLTWESRAAVFLRAAELAAGPWRDRLNAVTMVGQSKTAYQAEIDSACELVDFLRFNVHFMREIYEEQPLSTAENWNRLDYRPLEGFVFAVTPFNFTAILANLPTAPALMGNTVVWKPSERAMLSAHTVMNLLEEAGLPPGVINMIPTEQPASTCKPILEHPQLAGVHFTGSTATFQHLWRQVAENLSGYNSYPRIVGETGGKDFVVAHPSAEVESLVTALIRGAFDYQGQKCSAASRAYIPRSLWQSVTSELEETVSSIAVGPVEEFFQLCGCSDRQPCIRYDSRIHRLCSTR